MPRAVRYTEYGGIDVLQVDEVDRPSPGPRQFLLEVKAASINPGEAFIRQGGLHAHYPATFPSGQGYDLAGVIVEVGEDATPWKTGDEVIAFTFTRSAQADLVLVESDHAVPRPRTVSWEAAGSIYTVGATAYGAINAVSLRPGDTVVVAGAAGGVGCIAVQLAKRAGATVIGIASQNHHEWLAGHSIIPVAYGPGIADRIRQAATGRPIDAFVDTFGDGYVELALELGVDADRVDTVADFSAAQKYGVKTAGWEVATGADVLGKLVDLLANGSLELPIARTYPLTAVQDAYLEVEQRHTRGKIVLIP